MLTILDDELAALKKENRALSKQILTERHTFEHRIECARKEIDYLAKAVDMERNFSGHAVTGDAASIWIQSRFDWQTNEKRLAALDDDPATRGHLDKIKELQRCTRCRSRASHMMDQWLPIHESLNITLNGLTDQIKAREKEIRRLRNGEMSVYVEQIATMREEVSRKDVELEGHKVQAMVMSGRLLDLEKQIAANKV